MTTKGKQRAARVMMRGLPCGLLSEIAPSLFRFQYDSEWLAADFAEPISRALPLRPEPYDSATMHAFFLGLLPEGWLFGLATVRLKLSPDDPMGMVLALCRDCIGAVSVVPMREYEREQERDE